MLIGEYIVTGIFHITILLFWKRAVSVASKTTHGEQDLSIKWNYPKVGLLQHGDLLAGGRDAFPFHGVYPKTVDAVVVASFMAAVSSNVINVPANGSG